MRVRSGAGVGFCRIRSDAGIGFRRVRSSACGRFAVDVVLQRGVRSRAGSSLGGVRSDAGSGFGVIRSKAGSGFGVIGREAGSRFGVDVALQRRIVGDTGSGFSSDGRVLQRVDRLDGRDLRILRGVDILHAGDGDILRGVRRVDAIEARFMHVDLILEQMFGSGRTSGFGVDVVLQDNVSGGACGGFCGQFGVGGEAVDSHARIADDTVGIRGHQRGRADLRSGRCSNIAEANRAAGAAESDFTSGRGYGASTDCGRIGKAGRRVGTQRGCAVALCIGVMAECGRVNAVGIGFTADGGRAVTDCGRGVSAQIVGAECGRVRALRRGENTDRGAAVEVCRRLRTDRGGRALRCVGIEADGGRVAVADGVASAGVRADSCAAFTGGVCTLADSGAEIAGRGRVGAAFGGQHTGAVVTGWGSVCPGGACHQAERRSGGSGEQRLGNGLPTSG